MESIVEQPALMSHFTLSEESAAIGVRGERCDLLGVEDADDLIADLQQALERVPLSVSNSPSLESSCR